MFYIKFAALMCQRKQRMHRCSAESFGPLTGHLVPIVVGDVFARRWTIDKATICWWRRRTRWIRRAADGRLSASAPWLIVDC